MGPYHEALKLAIVPGCRVIDLGAGPGIFALMAAKLGAGSVVAIEPNDCVELLMPLARANGYAEQIEVFKGLSSDYSGPPADVIIADLRGPLPFHDGIVATYVDARARLLKSGGRLIAQRDILRIAVASAPEDYRRCAMPWKDNPFGLDLGLGHRYAVNSRRKVRLGADALMSQSADLFELDYRTVADSDMTAKFDLEVETNGTAHGLLLWFDSDLGEGIGFTNAPGGPHQVYGQILFPFARPVTLEAGDRVAGQVSAVLVGGDYVWSWTASCARGSQSLGHDFRHSTFLGRIFDPEALAKRAASTVPSRREIHGAVEACLGLIDGRRTLDDIAGELLRRFPGRFADAGAALDFAARIAAGDPSDPTKD